MRRAAESGGSLQRCPRIVFYIGCALLAGILMQHAAYRSGAAERAVAIANDPGADSAQLGGSRLRVLTFNIAHGRGLGASNWDGGTRSERRDRLDQIAALLRASDADIVVLNEVDFDAPWSHRVDQAAYLAERSGLRHLVAQCNIDVSLPFFTVRTGNAILSRFPIAKAEPLELPRYSAVEALVAGSKQGVVSSIEITPGRTLTVIAVHLDHRGEAIRVAAARRIAAVCAMYDGPLVLAGDLNSHHPDSPGAPLDPKGRNAIAYLVGPGGLSSGARPTSASAPYTVPSRTPMRAIDWILVNDQCVAENLASIRTTLSDHLPVYSTIDLDVSGER